MVGTGKNMLSLLKLSREAFTSQVERVRAIEGSHREQERQDKKDVT